MYSKSDLKADLTAMGLKGSETVIIHSSLKSIGEVEGRADGILDALTEFFKDGLLVFPSMSYNLVNAKQPVFSVRDTPCCVSMLPELFRRRPGVIRSLHPTHAVAAIGKDAAEFVAGHEKFDSPATNDGKIVILIQGKANESSGRLVPSGSGSAEYSTLEKKKD